jgi:hypothetical protein
MDASIYESAIAELPKSVEQRIKSCPAPGQGVNPWIFNTALSLTNYFEDHQVIEMLEAFVSCPGREREILRAVTRVREIAKGEEGGSGPRALWPAVDYAMANDIVVSSRVRLENLRKASPPVPSSEEILDSLFPGNPLLCLGRGKYSFGTEPREFWRGKESTYEFIVPNSMKSRLGKTQEGKDSARCLDNTGEREFQVVEFDMAEEGFWKPYIESWKAKDISTFDAQAALLVHLATKDVPRFNLVIAVHSGKKSLHGWFGRRGIEERQTRAFMDRAVRLGADPATWTRCQLVRMPGGIRDDGRRQQVEYFNARKLEVAK